MGGVAGKASCLYTDRGAKVNETSRWPHLHNPYYKDVRVGPPRLAVIPGGTEIP